MTEHSDEIQRIARQLDEPWDDPARTGERGARTAQRERTMVRARQIRDQVIDLSYELPNPPTQEMLDAWTVADGGLFRLIQALERSS